MIQIISRKKILLIPTSILVVLLIIATVSWERSFSAKINVESVPADSSIFLNNKKRHQGTIKVRPGVYKIVVSRQGFSTESKDVTVVRGEIKYVGIALISSSPDTASWYADHPSDAKVFEGISSKNLDLFSADQAKRLPLIKSLPLIDQLYRIDYGRSRLHPDDPMALAIFIKYYAENGKQQALEWLKFKGYNPNNLEIIYVDASGL